MQRLDELRRRRLRIHLDADGGFLSVSSCRFLLNKTGCVSLIISRGERARERESILLGVPLPLNNDAIMSGVAGPCSSGALDIYQTKNVFDRLVVAYIPNGAREYKKMRRYKIHTHTSSLCNINAYGLLYNRNAHIYMLMNANRKFCMQAYLIASSERYIHSFHPF